MSVSFESLSESDLIIDELYTSNGASNSSGDVLCKLMQVGSLGGFRKRLRAGSKNEIAYITLESTYRELDWVDHVDFETGIVTYWGDNRSPGRELHDTRLKGNVVLRDCYQWIFDCNRHKIPPFFYFDSAGGRDRRFVGLLVPGVNGVSFEEQLVAVWRSNQQKRYQNYKALFTILDVAQIDRRWLNDLINGNGQTSKYCPREWIEWIETGRRKPLTSTSIINYRNRDDQLPSSSDDMTKLEMIYRHFQNKYFFEKCAIRIAEMMDSSIHDCEHTRFVRDGGRDATGKYRIGAKADGIDVEFALEAKCYNPGKSEVGVSDMSRLISRLRYRQFGILITTSVVGKQAYKELREDGHPIIIVAGKDIVNILYSAGVKTIDEVKHWLMEFERK